MTLSPGTRLGSYEIVAPLGAGGMGEVYRARDTRLDRDVAVKILQSMIGSDPSHLSRFEREAKTLAALNHPHIAQIYGLERGPAGGAQDDYALVMELVDGPTLAERLQRGPVAVDECVHIARQIAEALEAAHEAGIIHRDIKPANIKVRNDGTVKVLDFGLAKATGDTPGVEMANSPTLTSPAMTAAGIILGTAAYMSPEQARGQQVDKRADIWAFGCVLYEMLTGKPPFDGNTITDVIAAVVKSEPDWSALHAPPRLRALVTRCLQKDTRQRLRDIGDARLELADTLITVAPDASGPTSSRSRIWLATAAVLILAAGIATGIIWQRTRASSNEPASSQWNGTRLGGPAIAMNPRISPDGQLVAFVTVVDNLTQVAVMKPQSGNWSVLTRDRTQGLTFAISWAADSSRIFYDRNTDSPRGIYSVPALGGEERLVIENANTPEPLDDGSLIFQRINNDRQLQLHRLWPANGRIEALPAVLPMEEAESQLRRLPGGRSIAFIGRPLTGAETSPGLYEMNLESKQVRRFGAGLPGPVPGPGVRPALAVDPMDGSAIVAVREGSVRRLYRIARDPAIEPVPLLMLQLPQATLDAGPDGAVYLSLSDRPVRILRLDTAKGTVEQLAAGPSISSLGVAPLPDGRILIPSRAGESSQILVMSPGKEPTPLVETEEDTRPPMTAVGDQHAALIIGSGGTSDIAIVVANTGRIIERFPAPPRIVSLAASPDGKTLYVAAGGSISALARGGSQARTVGAGDSITVDPESGDIIAKLDEQDRFRLVRIPAAGGAAQPIPFNGPFGMITNALTPGAVRNGHLALPLSTPDSWDWHAGVLELRTGKVERLVPDYRTDFHFVTHAADGTPIAAGLGFNTTLWKFTTVRAKK